MADGRHASGVTPLSNVACEVLGCLVPFDHSGPHHPHALRRHTRLTAADFARGLDELAGRGLVAWESGAVWMTLQGEACAARMFCEPDAVEEAMA